MQETRQVVDQTELRGLLEIITDLKKQLQKKDERISYLEFVLTERFQAAQNRYQDPKLQEYFRNMRGMILKLFLEQSAGAGLTYNEILEQFQSRYPRVPAIHLNRRIRELVTEEKKLWTSPDKTTGKIRFYLKLKDDKEPVERLKLSNSHNKRQGESIGTDSSH